MSNPPPVKVTPRPTGRDAVAEPLPTPQFPGLSTIPAVPSYSFPSTDTRDLRIVKATFAYGTQNIDCTKYLKPNISYGYLEYPMKALVNDLKDANILTPPDDPTSLNLHPPKLFVKYIDPEGYHSKVFGMEDTIILGKLTVWGLFLKKPGQLSWVAALAAGRIQFWLTVAVFWILMIVWAFKMWTHMKDMGLSWKTATAENFGDYGKIFAAIAGVFAPLGVTRYIMAFIAAMAPVWSFCIQFAMWYFVDSQIDHKLGPAPAAVPTAAPAAAGEKMPSIIEGWKMWKASRGNSSPATK